jgi:hypothetical protein
VKISPPANIMLARPWNTIAERNILDLMELLLDKENEGKANNLDNYLMGFLEGDDMDVNTLPSVESDDPIEDFGEEEPFDLIRDLLLMTVSYGEYILEDLQANVQFNTQHLRIDLLSEVECMGDFRFRKEDPLVLWRRILFLPSSNQALWASSRRSMRNMIVSHRVSL